MTSLTELTDIIMTMNHNITNHGTGLLQKKLAQMEFQYSKDPAIAPLLRMMQSLRRYLDSKKGSAHPDSIPVLLSIADRFENIIKGSDFDPDKDMDRINRIVSEEIKKYKILQSKINLKPVVRDMDLNNLKTVILAIDWEISDNTLQHFEKVVREFLSAYQENKIHHYFLKIIQSLGSYIGSRKVNAHPDAISFLRSVFDDFEKTVQTPGMSPQDKKEILEKNINRFHELKIRLSREKGELKPFLNNTEEEFLPPALSHIKPASKISSKDVIPITPFTESDESEFKNTRGDTDDIKPALSNRQRPPSAPRDVMGDLLSLKESPADELLDAIHLMDIRGSNQDPASHMRNQDIHSPSGRIKQFTPRLKNNEPIPEIEDRLNEFFNPETSSKPSAPQMPPADQTTELTAEPEEDKSEGIVPFRYEDESVEPGNSDPDDNKKQKKDGVPDLLGRLKTRIETLGGLKPEPVLSSIENDVSDLKILWQNDSEKSLLLELLVLSIRFAENSTKDFSKTGGPGNYQKKDPIPRAFEVKPSGILARIKAIFTS